jgi:hypothetical protein
MQTKRFEIWIADLNPQIGSSQFIPLCYLVYNFVYLCVSMNYAKVGLIREAEGNPKINALPLFLHTILCLNFCY